MMDIAMATLIVLYIGFIVLLAWVGSPYHLDKWVKKKLYKSK